MLFYTSCYFTSVCIMKLLNKSNMSHLSDINLIKLLSLFTTLFLFLEIMYSFK